MAKGLVTDTYLADIANVIRTKNGTETQYKPSEMAGAIENISTKAKPDFVLFEGYAATSLNLSWLDTSNITDMTRMFSGCNNLTELNLSNFDTSNVTDMARMFDNCNNLTELNLSNFDTSNVTDMTYMFRNCEKLEQLDLSSFDFSKIVGNTRIFQNCGSANSTPTIVYVKDTISQEWILGLPSFADFRPGDWTTSNVIIKNQ